MLSLVLTILFVHIAIYLVNTIGATTIDSLVRLIHPCGFVPGCSQLFATRRAWTPADSRPLPRLVMASLPETADINLSKCT